MRNSHDRSRRDSSEWQREIHRSGHDRRPRRGNKEKNEGSSNRGRRHQRPPRMRRQILQVSERDRNRDHIPSHRRRNRPPTRRDHFISHHPNRRALARMRNREEVFVGKPGYRRVRNMRRRFRWNPPVDFCESNDRYIVNIELPGVSQEHISVTVTENRLTIKGVKKPDKTDDNLKVRRSKRQFGRFRLTFPLPPKTVVSDIKADFKDGILSVVVPKSETAKPTEIPINSEE